MTPVRLVAVDLDGTLIGSDLTISAVDRAAIAGARASGVDVCIATGRLFSAGRPYADELGLDGYLIPLNGAAVFEVRSGRMIRAVPVRVEVAREALDTFRAANLRPQLYFGDRLYLDGMDERAQEYLRMSRVEPVIVEDLSALLDGARPSDPGPMKVLGIGTPAEVDGLVFALAGRFGARANVFRSLPQYIEVTDPGADKGTALAWLAGHLGLTSGQVAAVGDSDNDAPMLRWAGRSYCVAGGSSLAKAAAGRVVGPRGAGVAQALADTLEGAAV